MDLRRRADHRAWPRRGSVLRSRRREGRWLRPVADLQLELPRDVEAPAGARAALGELCLRAGLAEPLRQSALLLVSELVSNAVLHSTGPADGLIALSASVREEALRVVVTDAGEGFDPGQRAARADGGYGLALLERTATCWGVDAQGPTSVWFELALYT